MWTQIQNSYEIHGEGDQGMLIKGDAVALSDDLLTRYGQQVQCLYVDPPFYTGDSFSLRMRVGERGYLTDKQYITLPAYADQYTSREEYLAFMKKMITLAHGLLGDTGVFFLHIDHRMAAHLRLLCDEVFGEKHFLNEIVWVYQTGGRAKRHFSRKHDTILFYAKSRKYYFDITKAPLDRAQHRRNHMRRQIDAEGRAYRTITSNGKTYTYYDDEPTYPSDVWDDVSHLQQKDPQRTGYDTQKPMRLLSRMIACTTKEGDLVADLCCGSGTTLAAAAEMNRCYLGIDSSEGALSVTQKRLMGKPLSIQWPSRHIGAVLDGELSTSLASYQIKIKDFRMADPLPDNAVPPGLTATGLEAIDQWSAGLYKDGVYMVHAQSGRTKRYPALSEELHVPLFTGKPALSIVDVLGRRSLWVFEE